MAQRANRTAKGKTVGGRIELLLKTARRDKKEFFKALASALSDRSPTVRDKAVLFVTENGFKGAAELVEALLYDSNEDVRYDAARCIGILQRGRKSSPSGLRDLLRDHTPVVRAQALESLALLEDKGALPEIARLLSDGDPVVRSYAASAVGALGGGAYLKQVSRGLSAEKDDLARVGFYEALFLLGKREVFPEMLKMLELSNYHVRCSVANALEGMPLRGAEVQLASAALVAANRKPLAVADETTIRRVLKVLRMSNSS